MRILVTGRNGQVGWELLRTLAPLGEVVAPARAQLDLASPDSIVAALRDIRPGLIVNAAAYTAVDKAESEPDLAMAINGTAPGILAEEGGRLGAALIHYSTDYVFDGAAARPYTEQDEANPLNVYGRTKLAGERAVAAAGAPHLILRTSWVYGARGRNFLLTMLKLAQERDELKIVADQTGAPTWSRLIAEATAQIVAQGSHSGRLLGESGIYHLTAAGQTSWFGFARAILDRAAAKRAHRPRLIPIPATEYPLPAHRPAWSVMSNTKLVERFGLALPSWETCLELCLQELDLIRGS